MTGDTIISIPKTQVKKAVNFHPPDYLPFWDNFWGNFPEKWRRYMGLPSSASPKDYYRICVSTVSADETLFPSRSGKVIRNESPYENVDDGWGRVIRRRKGGYFSETVERIMESPGDLKKIKPEPAELENRFRGFVRRVQEEEKQGVYVLGRIGGLYCRGQFIRGEEDLSVDMMLNKGFCGDFFDMLELHLTRIALQVLRKGKLWENGLLVSDDMAGSKMPSFSPAIFEEFFLPRYKRMVATLKRAGCAHVFLHSDGNIGPFMDLLVEAGFEGFNPLEPSCGLDLIKLRRKYGTKAVFFGGVCNKFILPGGDKKTIEAHVKPLVELGRDGGLIIGQASIGGDVSPEAYDYYLNLVREYGDYSGQRLSFSGIPR